MLKKIIHLFIISLIVIMTTSLGYAKAKKEISHVHAGLISETESIQPGHSFWVAIDLKMDKDWHVYWKNPGDSGLPVRIKWTLPDGFKALPLQWPIPQKIDTLPLRSYGYKTEVLLQSQIQTPKALAINQEQIIKAHVSWLVCKEECIPGHADIFIKLPVSLETPKINANCTFGMTRFNLPIEKSPWTITALSRQHSLIFALTYPNKKKYPLSDVYFFPERDDLINHAADQILRPWADGYELIVPRTTITSKPLTQIKGVLFSKEGWLGPQTQQGLLIDVPVTQEPINPNKPTRPQIGLILALLFAFIGGLILNLMPCVLPVLSIKILGLINHSTDNKSRIRFHGLCYTLGILVSFWILASLLIALKFAGQQIGWGFQFQSPLFLIFLSLLFLLLALNLLGLFEIILPLSIQGPSKTQNLLNSFLNGVLATITATPCTAPFMGTALGFALSQPPYTAVLIFTFLGLGLAFPYFLLCLFPSLLIFLPKPGRWMAHLKRLLGVLLLLTVLWLLWILNAEIGFIKMPQTQASTPSQINWQPYSSKLIKQLQEQHRIIFIDFTAKWCLTCQANERLALDNEKVIKKFRELNVATVKADWTRPNADITNVLTEFGKDSIPLYVLYEKDATTALLLPEIITPQIILDALDKIKH
ncbi:MAG: thioredoxin family protein [Candidatus Omnitrophica bacterium]|nr:thioredoxin family protein [Candidatus Omnitrophota bacterium]